MDQTLCGWEILCNHELSPDLIKQYQPPSFNQFKATYEKQYATAQQEEQRCLIYYDNVQRIRQEALQVTWQLAVNHLFDMSQTQWDNWRDLKTESNPKQNLRINVGQSVAPPNAPPNMLDWRENKGVTSIKNQGSCGSCWSFATCAYGESRLLIRSNRQNRQPDLSEQYLIDCISQNSCSGGYLESSFKKAGQDGIPSEKISPYKESDTGTSWLSCLTLGTTRIGYIPQAEYGVGDERMKQLLQIQPLAISIASSGWMGYSGGTFSCTPGAQVDHAVLLVGYNQNQWIIKNQWGSDWGEQGYMRVTRGRNNNCGIGTSIFYMSEFHQTFATFLSIFVVFMMIW